jgi:hypothetical protein
MKPYCELTTKMLRARLVMSSLANSACEPSICAHSDSHALRMLAEMDEVGGPHDAII